MLYSLVSISFQSTVGKPSGAPWRLSSYQQLYADTVPVWNPPTHARTYTHKQTHLCLQTLLIHSTTNRLTDGQALSLHVSAHSPHRGGKRDSSSWKTTPEKSSSFLISSLFFPPCSPLCLSPAPHSLSLGLSVSQGTMTLFSLFFRLSSDCTIHINYSEAVSGFPRQSQSQMELCANGLLLYLPPAPSCSETLGHRESG